MFDSVSYNAQYFRRLLTRAQESVDESALTFETLVQAGWSSPLATAGGPYKRL